MSLALKFLVIGLGSMGKRRIRNLLSLGYKGSVAGFDTSEARRVEAEETYGIPVYDSFEEAYDTVNPSVLIISTPPQAHMEYAYFGFEHSLHCFIEASVIHAKAIHELHTKNQTKQCIIVPSCTMLYYSGPKMITQLVESGVIGKPYNFNYHTGQYLPHWHPWEDIQDFYVSNPETGGCREIVPFELTWLNRLFGHPKPLACVKRKLTDLTAPIDDIYHCVLEYPQKVLGNMTVEVISQPKATRYFHLIGSQGELVFDGEQNSIKYCNEEYTTWQRIDLDKGSNHHTSINPEEPYIHEIREFIHAIKCNDGSQFPNTLKKDYEVLQLLYELEALA